MSLPVKVAINGFGRIGRNVFKAALEEHPDELDIVGINDLTDPKVLAHLLEYDTAYGHWDKKVESDEKSIIIDGKHYPIFAEKDPTQLPWGKLGVDVVIESTGRFTDEKGMQQHITAGAKRVVLSAPAKDGNVGTFLIGVNHDKYANQALINNASCTSNCLAPVIAILLEKFGIQKALYTTVHSVTAEQNLVDGPPPGGKTGDLRRARAAYCNMIPTTTGAAIAVTQAIPEMEGFMDGRAIRVPTITGSITDFTVLLKRKTTIEEVNQAFKDAVNTPRWKGIVAWTEEPIVSSDIIGRSESSIVDLSLTQIVDGDLVKVFAWYDNEWGYSNRLVEQVINVGKTVSGDEGGAKKTDDKPSGLLPSELPQNSAPAAPAPSHEDLTLPPPPPQPSQADAANYHPFFNQPQVAAADTSAPTSQPLAFQPNQAHIDNQPATPPAQAPAPTPTTPASQNTFTPPPVPTFEPRAVTNPTDSAAQGDQLPPPPAPPMAQPLPANLQPPTVPAAPTPSAPPAFVPPVPAPFPTSTPAASPAPGTSPAGAPPANSEPVIHDHVFQSAPNADDHKFNFWPFGK
jgi:glyceraldehyde 3-phosphate dehydrogenase